MLQFSPAVHRFKCLVQLSVWTVDQILLDLFKTLDHYEVFNDSQKAGKTPMILIDGMIPFVQQVLSSAVSSTYIILNPYARTSSSVLKKQVFQQ
jgi:hypothetical protein